MPNLFSIRNKRILITGGSGGLGLAFAKGLGDAGAIIMLNGRDRKKLKEAQKTLERRKIRVHLLPFDVTKPGEVKKAISLAEKKIGPVDVLINNAGINLRGPLESVADKTWKQVIDINLSGVFYTAREVAAGMIKRKAGKIINISSLMSEAARPSTGPYTASKGGVKLLTKAMAAEWGRHNIQVNAVGPGYFLTEMTANLARDKVFDEWVRKRTPAGRWGKPEELIGALIFLSSTASDFVNGQALYVDGGFLSQL
jgi:gluconate 5-dehydrogenase